MALHFKKIRVYFNVFIGIRDLYRPDGLPEYIVALIEKMSTGWKGAVIVKSLRKQPSSAQLRSKNTAKNDKSPKSEKTKKNPRRTSKPLESMKTADIENKENIQAAIKTE